MKFVGLLFIAVLSISSVSASQSKTVPVMFSFEKVKSAKCTIVPWRIYHDVRNCGYKKILHPQAYMQKCQNRKFSEAEYDRVPFDVIKCLRKEKSPFFNYEKSKQIKELALRIPQRLLDSGLYKDGMFGETNLKKLISVINSKKNEYLVTDDSLTVLGTEENGSNTPRRSAIAIPSNDMKMVIFNSSTIWRAKNRRIEELIALHEVCHHAGCGDKFYARSVLMFASYKALAPTVEERKVSLGMAHTSAEDRWFYDSFGITLDRKAAERFKKLAPYLKKAGGAGSTTPGGDDYEADFKLQLFFQVYDFYFNSFSIAGNFVRLQKYVSFEELGALFLNMKISRVRGTRRFSPRANWRFGILTGVEMDVSNDVMTGESINVRVLAKELVEGIVCKGFLRQPRRACDSWRYKR